eukprot:m.81821 g.81821  ORF g.81821 m.81821 type:complete len:213 (-) comp12831_c0_seq2:56-694(-)
MDAAKYKEKGRGRGKTGRGRGAPKTVPWLMSAPRGVGQFPPSAYLHQGGPSVTGGRAPAPSKGINSKRRRVEDDANGDFADAAPTAAQGTTNKRKKIEIKYIQDKSRRHITFSKRRSGIFKKAYELSTLTGTEVLLVVASETGNIHHYVTPRLRPLINDNGNWCNQCGRSGTKETIQACLMSEVEVPPNQDSGEYANNSGGSEEDDEDDDEI